MKLDQESDQAGHEPAAEARAISSTSTCGTSTSWAPDAMTRSEEVQTALKDRAGIRDIQMNITPEQRKAIAEKQFANAQYQPALLEAAAPGLRRAGQFPDAIRSPSRRQRVRPHLHPDGGQRAGDRRAEAVLRAVRRDDHGIWPSASRRPPRRMTLAGDELRRIADAYGERNQFTMRDATMSLFFTRFTEHPLAALLLMAAAEKLYKADDFAGAAPYYQRPWTTPRVLSQRHDAPRRLPRSWARSRRSWPSQDVRRARGKTREARQRPCRRSPSLLRLRATRPSARARRRRLSMPAKATALGPPPRRARRPRPPIPSRRP